MALADPARRPSAGIRRTGYAVAIGVNAALLVLLNGRPGWQVIPFLTSGVDQVLWLVNLSLAVGVAVNAVYLVHDPPLVKSLGDLLTTGTSLVAAVRVWQVFPFDVTYGWSTALRVLLVVVIAGSVIALVVQMLALVRSLAGHGPHRSVLTRAHG